MADLLQVPSVARYWPGGMDSWTSPDALDKFTYIYGHNVLNKGGRPTTRPGSKTLFCLPFGNLQGGTLFTARNGTAHLVAAVDGLIYVSPAPFSEWRLLPNIQFNEASTFVTMTSCLKSTTFDAEGVPEFESDPFQVLVFQDDRTRAAYWDGSTSRHLNPKRSNTEFTTVDGFDETKIGLHSVWSNNRLWVSRGRLVFASDHGNPLKFTESQYIAEAPAFILPDECTGMIETADASGILCFYADGADFIETSNQDRAQWLDTPDIQRPALNVGCIAPRSLVTQHSMIYWFSPKGFINLNEALKTNINSEIVPIDVRMTASKCAIGPDLSLICAGAHENIALVSVPFCSKSNTHTWALDVSVANDTTKAWASVWTGWQPVQWASGTIAGQERIFAFTTDSDGANRVWEMMLGNRRDNGCDITSSIQLRLDTFDSDEVLKKFKFSIIEMDRLEDEVSIMVAVAGNRGWFERIATKEITATYSRVFGEQTYGNGVEFPRLASSKRQTRIFKTQDLATPAADGCNACGVESLLPVNIDYGFTIAIAWSGPGAIKSIRSFADEWTENTLTGACEEAEEGVRVVNANGCSSRELYPTTEGNFPVITETASAAGAGINNDADSITVDTCARSQISVVDAQRRAQCKASAQLNLLRLASTVESGTFIRDCTTITIVAAPVLGIFSEDGTVAIDVADLGSILWGTTGTLTLRLVNIGQGTLVLDLVELLDSDVVIVSGPEQTELGASEFTFITLELAEPNFVDL